MILSGPGSGVGVLMSVQEFKDIEENESADSKTKFFVLFRFGRVRSRESYNLYCTTILSSAQTNAQTKFEHQCDVITFQPHCVLLLPCCCMVAYCCVRCTCKMCTLSGD